MFTPASLQRIISASKNELEIMAPRHRIREHIPTVKAMARLTLARSWPKPKRAHSNISSVLVPAFGSSQIPAKKVKTYSKFHSPRNRIMDTFSRFSAHMPLQRRVCNQNTINYIPQPDSVTSSPAVSLQRRDTDSTAANSREQLFAETWISTPPTTRAPSPEVEFEVAPKCLTLRGRHAKSYAIRVPANSVWSTTSGSTGETPHCPRKLPYSRRQQAISQEPSKASKKPFTALEKLNHLKREIEAYHKTRGRGNQDSAQGLLGKYGINIPLHSLQPAERAHLISCIYRRAYDFEASLVPPKSTILDSNHKYPRFFPQWQTVDDFDWKYHDHEGNIRPEAYVAMAEETGEEGPFTRKELEMLKMEGFRDAKFEMGECWWGEVEGWVLDVEVGVDEMGMRLKGYGIRGRVAD